MAYVDGFLFAVPKANKDKFAAHARDKNAIYLDLGALRLRECWQDESTHAGPNGFAAAVHAQDDEAVVFSWIEWPDLATRTAALERVRELRKSDPHHSMENDPYPFDTSRMIFSGFVPIVSLGQ
jgi:uncharacterized protein YbaA (DUF1428 family)